MNPPPARALKRVVTLPLLVFFILGDVLGAGVYALAGAIADRAGGAIWAPLAVGLLFALFTAASYAELVSKYPRAGGAAVFAQRAFGSPLLSFLVGFAMLAAGITSVAGLALAFAGEYLRVFLDWPTHVLAPLFLLLIAALNLREADAVTAETSRAAPVSARAWSRWYRSHAGSTLPANQAWQAARPVAAGRFHPRA